MQLILEVSDKYEIHRHFFGSVRGRETYLKILDVHFVCILGA